MGGKPVSLCVMDFGFIGGSMGSVVGEKVARAGEAALAERIPLIIVSSSGGARMQEGTYALMQLVKTMGVVERVKAARVPFISVLTDPTTGGVFASFAVVGDVNIAEPNAIDPLRRRPRLGRNHRRGAAARIPALRVLVQPRLRGPDRALGPTCATTSSPCSVTWSLRRWTVLASPWRRPSSRPRSLLSALTGALAGDYGDSRNGDSRNGGRGGEANGSRGEASRG